MSFVYTSVTGNMMDQPNGRRKEDRQPLAEITMRDARRSFSDVLNRVFYARERIAITRQGRVVAIVTPPAPDREVAA